MMARYRFTALAFAAVTAMALMTPLPAAAQSAEDLRRDGQACELPNGYMRAIDNSVRSVVQRINDQRRQVYEDKARAEGVSVEAVGQIYARELRSKPHYLPC